jgi:hypothetical protein
MTVSSTPPSVISTGQGSPEDLAEVTSQALAALEFDTAMLFGTFDAARAAEIFTPNAQKQLPAVFEGFQLNRRYERAGEERLAPYQVRFGDDRKSADVLICLADSIAEYDTKGTSDRADDSLVPSSGPQMASVGLLRLNGRWIVDGYEAKDEVGACDGLV